MINIKGLVLDMLYFSDFLSGLIIGFFLILAFCFLLVISEMVFFIFIKLFSFMYSSIKKRFFREVIYGDEPYSMVLDYILPYSLLFSSFWPLFLHFHFLVNFIIMILYYIIILLPFFSFWEKLRNWESLYIIHNFSNPTNVRYFIVGLVYPYIFILLFGMLRYIAIGNLQDFSGISVDNCIYIICLCLYLLPFLCLVLSSYINLRDSLIHHTNKCGYSLHLYLLRNSLYKKFAYIMFKAHFIITRVLHVSGIFNSTRNIKFPKVYRILWYIWYKNPNIVLSLVPICLFFELIIYRQIYYSYYFLFWFFLFRIILGGFRLYNRDGMHIRLTLNDSNYINENSWKNPDFPEDLFYKLNDPYTFDAPCLKVISENQLIYLKTLCDQQKRLPFTDTLLRSGKSFWQTSHIRKLPLFRKIKLFYLDSVGRRWVHTSSTPVIIHPVVPRLIHGTFARLAMISEPADWVAVFSIIQRVEKITPSGNIAHIYNADAIPASIMQHYPKETSIVAATEHNLRTSFSPWVARNVTITPHVSGNKYANLMKQAAPDLSANFKGSSFKEQNLLAFDQKTTIKGRALNIILGVSQEKYKAAIRDYERFAAKHDALTEEARDVLKKLVIITDIEARMQYYGDNLHLFTGFGQLPPINLEKMISDKYFLDQYKIAFSAMKAKIKLMSLICHSKFPINASAGPNFQKQTSILEIDPNIIALVKDISSLSSF